MKLCYALRRGVFYPNARDAFGEMPPREHRPKYLALVRSFGFEGVEIPVVSGEAAADAAAEDLGAVLRDAGVPAVCVRGGGAIAHPTAGLAARDRLEAAIRLAARIGAGVVNATCVTPSTHPGGPGHDRRGEPVSQGGSRTASVGDFERTAEQFRRFGALAGDLGVEISIEVHQGSIADNSAAALALIDLIGLDNVGVNPDLGNIYWHYEHPEETAEAAIVALAPRSTYWHCKNLRRIHIPELRRAIFQRVPLPDGDLDYRFAVAAMADAGYRGYLAVEGAREGDQLSADGRSAAYARALLAEI